MIRIGLTGGIASGKTTVSRMLTELGARVIDADVLAREAVAPGSPGLRQVVDAFGAEMLRSDGTLDRKRLGALVFRDAQARQRLNAIVHPIVRRRMQEEIDRAQAAGLRAVVLDIPLLFESGLDGICDRVWVVYVDPQTQLERLMQRDGLSEAEARLRLEAQLPVEEKARRADAVIDNTRDATATRRQVAKLWGDLLDQAGPADAH